MRQQECVAMLLAGGQGSRLGALTKKIAKPAVAFGGKYRIIDFSLSNCTNSNINTVGVLTQYKPLLLNSYISTGAAWDLDDAYGGVFLLPPYATETGGQWYQGTADAIFQNIDFIDNYDPQYVLVISGDHLYKMDYSLMLDFHKKNDADLTISVMEVPWEDASRFGILTADDTGRISKFSEKPKNPDSNLASMGIYIFSWPVLKEALLKDSLNSSSDHDFGKNVIPMLLGEGKNFTPTPSPVTGKTSEPSTATTTRIWSCLIRILHLISSRKICGFLVIPISIHPITSVRTQLWKTLWSAMDAVSAEKSITPSSVLTYTSKMEPALPIPSCCQALKSGKTRVFSVPLSGNSPLLGKTRS